MPSAPKKKRSRSLAELVPAAMGEVMAGQGFAGGEIVLRWREIAGPGLADRSQPVKITWPHRPQNGDPQARAPGTLLVQVDSAFALELQMQSEALLERINRYFGWRCVAAIRMRQGRVGKPAAPRVSLRAVRPDQEARLRETVSGITDERLEGALLRLGRNVALDDGRA